ncbi:MAG: TolC family protein [Elusimicrobiota bacterium]
MNNIIRKYLFSTALLVPVFLTGSTVYASTSTMLTDLIDNAINSNYEVQSTKKRVDARVTEEQGAAVWDIPSINMELSDKDFGVSLSQGVPLTKKYYYRKSIAGIDTAMAKNEFENVKREVILKTKEFYWSYWLAYKKMGVLNEQRGLAQRYKDIAEVQYSSGKVQKFDVLKSVSALAQVQSMFDLAQQEVASSQLELNLHLARMAETPVGTPATEPGDTITTDLSLILYTAFNTFPQYKVKTYDLLRASYTYDLARAEWIPDLMLGVKQSAMYGTAAMIQTGIPFLWNKQSASVKAAKENIAVSAVELAGERNAMEREIKMLWARYTALKFVTETYTNTVIPNDRQALSLTETGYISGKNMYYDLLDSQQRFLDNVVEYYTYLHELQMVFAKIEYYTGTDIQTLQGDEE